MSSSRPGDTNAVVLAGMCTALAVVLSLIGLYMPMISTIIFFLIPLPIAYLGMKQGTRWSVIVTSGVLILDSVFFGVMSAAFLCASFGILGVVLGLCWANHVDAKTTLFAGAAVSLAALVGEAAITVFLLDLPSTILSPEAFDEIEKAMSAMLPGFYSGESLAEAQASVKQMVEIMKKGMLVNVIGAAFFYSWASMTLGKMVFNRMGITDIPQLPPLERWELPRIFLVIGVIGLALQFGLPNNEWASLIGYNLWALAMMAFWLQGMATLWWMPRRYPFMRILRWFIAILSLFGGFFGAFMLMLGVYDMIVGYRRRYNYE